MARMMLVLTILTLALTCVSGTRRRHFLYWNTTNPDFRMDNIVDVNQDNLPWEYDQLNIICPISSAEKHVIYSVSKEEFDSCRVSNPRPKIVAVCDRPHSFQYFTITFRSFSPSPGGLEFKPGHNYYFVSTSNSNDVHRRVGGYCSSHNMKMVFKVGENREQETVKEKMMYNSPLYLALASSTVRPSTTTKQDPVVREFSYYKSTPTVRTSDYLYYYSHRDLAQLKLAANKHKNLRSRENQTYRADKLTSQSTVTVATKTSLVLTLLIVMCL